MGVVSRGRGTTYVLIATLANEIVQVATACHMRSACVFGGCAVFSVLWFAVPAASCAVSPQHQHLQQEVRAVQPQAWHYIVSCAGRPNSRQRKSGYTPPSMASFACPRCACRTCDVARFISASGMCVCVADCLTHRPLHHLMLSFFVSGSLVMSVCGSSRAICVCVCALKAPLS